MEEINTSSEPLAKVECKDGSKINVWCSHTALVDIDLVLPNPKNPNTHPARQIVLLARVIKEQGWRAPITISTRSMKVVKGHGRLMAGKSNGSMQVPVDYQNYDSEAAEIADLLADNKIAELSEIDSELEKTHKMFLEDMGFELELAGFEVDEKIAGDGNGIELDEESDNVDTEKLAKKPIWFGFRTTSENSTYIAEFNELAKKYNIKAYSNDQS